MSAGPAGPAEGPSSRTASARLRARLRSSEVLVLPGAFDAGTARVIADLGFEAIYATGAGIANAHLGRPDVGLLTMTEMAAVTQRIVEASSVPVIADTDTGYGNVVNVVRTVQEFERLGVAGIQLEDQVFPKRCGHFAGKEVISADEMVQKLRAAREARRDGELVIIARTDARAPLGLAEAIRRGRLFADAGADAVFVEAPESIEELAAIGRALGDVPLVANLVEGGRTPIVPAADLQRLGFKIALYANTALRAAWHGVIAALERLRRDGTSQAAADLLVPWQERQRLVGLPEVEALEARYRG